MKKLLLLVLMLSLLSYTAFAGVEWITEMKMSGKGKNANNVMDMHGYAQDGNVKIVYEGVSSESELYKQKGYWLYKAESDDIYVVDTEKEEFFLFNLDQILQMSRAMGGMVKITIQDYSSTVEAMPSENILGYNCNHVKITSEYTMKIKVAFVKKSMKMREVKEVWGSTEVPGLKEMAKHFLLKNMKTGFEDLDAMIAKEMKNQKEIGFPLKMVSESNTLDKKGKVKDINRTEMTVKKLEAKSLPADFFSIPANYKHKELPTDGDKPKLF